jgi:hypothetical protein
MSRVADMPVAAPNMSEEWHTTTLGDSLHGQKAGAHPHVI